MRNKRQIQIIILILMTISIVGAVFLWTGFQGEKGERGLASLTETETGFQPALEVKEVIGDNGQVIYHHPKYNFSFQCDKDLKVTAFDEAEGEIVLIQNSENLACQIFIIPFDEAGPITPERIRQDLPYLVIDEPQEAIIGQEQIRALIFFSQEESLGKTREIWFVHNGYLYQVITYAELDSWIGQILESWRFQL